MVITDGALDTTVTVLPPGAFDEAVDTRPAVTLCPAHAAYVMHTSGSTGEPKGVVISHGAFVGGVGLARGYLGRPAMTAERFLPDPFGPPGARMYRTGDRVRWRSDGRLEYDGRLDAQVKVNGVRIEPAEVESALAAHPGVRAAAVTAHPGPDGAARGSSRMW